MVDMPITLFWLLNIIYKCYTVYYINMYYIARCQLKIKIFLKVISEVWKNHYKKLKSKGWKHGLSARAWVQTPASPKQNKKYMKS
jgi:hypothetical protein